MIRKKVWIDIETTDLDEETADIHQIALKCDKDEINCYIRFGAPIKHNLPIPFDVRRVTLEDALVGIYDFVVMLANKYDPPTFTKDDWGETIEHRKGMIFAGKNPLFDWKFLMKHKLFQDIWKKYFHYNLFDLTAVIYFLQDLGIIDSEQSSSLENLVKTFDIKLDGHPHDALFDIRACEKIYTKCMELVKKVPKSKSHDKKEFVKIVKLWYPNLTDKEILDSINNKTPPYILNKPVSEEIVKTEVKLKPKPKKKPTKRKTTTRKNY